MSLKLIVKRAPMASALFRQSTPLYGAFAFRRSFADKKETPPLSVKANGDKKPIEQPAKQTSKEIDQLSLNEPNPLKEQLAKLQKDISIANTGASVATTQATEFEDRTEKRFQFMTGFGVIIVLLGVCGAIVKVYWYDVRQETQMRFLVKNTFNKLEKQLVVQIANLDEVTASQVDGQANRLDDSITNTNLSSKFATFSDGKQK
ncbi:hypothetical protein B9Z19DRAFT_1134142 [Tuber borchii]|uniref:Uncharacterized protein n=1 Tax=Tuber borchii TaxID=42251 RepID=A0A2T6ZEU0_TUBBO|nr:hypothetical protein B9Z19DRAFT_1134142 [Tuber borchii]